LYTLNDQEKVQN